MSEVHQPNKNDEIYHYGLPYIIIDEFDRWYAEQEKCPTCNKKFKNLDLDTIGNDETGHHLLFVANCCNNIIYIVPKPNERIYVEEVSSDELYRIKDGIVTAAIGIGDLELKMKKSDWKMFEEFGHFYEDWIDKLKAKIRVLEEYEKSIARDEITFAWRSEFDTEPFHVASIYAHEKILDFLEEDERQQLEGREIEKIEFAPNEQRLTFIVFPLEEGENQSV